ncbi:MAG: hypothetical protein CMF48_03000 [Legionellales bacterium]|nr:hypothetical protein [Legionellales bacterium]
MNYKSPLLIALILSISVYAFYGYWFQTAEYNDWIACKGLMRSLVNKNIKEPDVFRKEAKSLIHKVHYGAAHQTLAELYKHMNEFALSEQAYYKAIESTNFDYINEKSVLGLIELYFLHPEMNNEEQGVRLAADFVKSHPDHPAALNYLAIHQYNQGNYLSAVDGWERILTQTTDWHLRSTLVQTILKAEQRVSEKAVLITALLDFSDIDTRIEDGDVLYVIIKAADNSMPWIASKFSAGEVYNSSVLLGRRMALYSLPEDQMSDLYLEALVSKADKPLPEDAIIRSIRYPLSNKLGSEITVKFH